MTAYTPPSPHAHFRRRVAERFGPDTDPSDVWQAIVTAWRDEDWSALRFISRLHRGGHRVFLMRLSDGRPLFTIIDCAQGVPTTVMPPGFVLSRQGRDPITLRVPDGW